MRWLIISQQRWRRERNDRGRKKIALLIDELEDIRCDNFDADTDEDKTLKEAIRVIKALEQEPCEDAISRQQTKSDYADWFGYGYEDNWFYKHLSNIPPVNPQEPKTGQWVLEDWNKWTCNKCRFSKRAEYLGYKYCPNCGAKMAESRGEE